MNQNVIENDYFEWLFELVCKNRYSNQTSYRKLLMELHRKPFRFLILMDENRAEDGVKLRYRFAREYDYPIDNADEYIVGLCSVLEMMIALAIRCEEDYMDNAVIGDRTRQWFWNMVTNLGLGSMDDNRFDRLLVNDILERFLNREYEPDGRGGLFRIKNCDTDLREVEIWHQMCWYLNNIV